MRWMLALAVITLSLAMNSASFAGYWGWGLGFRGNDTGGIIPWTPEIADSYRQIAAEHCARWHRIAKITSVHAWYGDFVGFRCLTDRSYDPRKAWYYSSHWFAPN